MKLRDWIRSNRSVFEDRDLRFLIKNLFSKELALVLMEDITLDKTRVDYLEKVKDKYRRGMPLPYLVGKEEFLGLEFKVNERVLIPRKETELIVEEAIEIIREDKLRYVLDLGCGCGVIGISIKKFLMEEVVVFASDISFDALKIARINSKLNKVKVLLVNMDLFFGFKKNVFDLIVTNPPYVVPNFIGKELKYEPRIALESPNNGLYFIEKILSRSYLWLKKRGYLVLEMGYNHKRAVEEIIKKTGVYEIIKWIRDYSYHWRGVALRVK